MNSEGTGETTTKMVTELLFAMNSLMWEEKHIIKEGGGNGISSVGQVELKAAEDLNSVLIL